MIEGSTAPATPQPPQRGGRYVERMTEQLKAQLAQARRWAWPLPQRATSDALLARLRLIERLLWVALILLGAYVVWSVWLTERHPPVIASHSPAVGPESSAAQSPNPEGDRLKELSEYREALALRNPFALSARSSGGRSDEEVKNKLTQLTGVLSVVGINRGASPEALIEHSEEKRTYFVKVGDQINGLTVRAIDQRGVVVSYEGEEIVLK
ncbi:MAG: hypothetical protein HY737_05930 [Candidatus Omnitrophica bacterium]|nr:hypothetical protein [Candidatus Omnitrophota bacterium]